MSSEAITVLKTTENDQELLRSHYLKLGTDIWNGHYDKKPPVNPNIDPETGLVLRFNKANEPITGLDWVAAVDNPNKPKEPNKPEEPMGQDERQELLENHLIVLGAKKDLYEKRGWKFDPEAERSTTMMALILGDVPSSLIAEIDAEKSIARLFHKPHNVPALITGGALGPPRPALGGGRYITDPTLEMLVSQLDDNYTDSGEPGLLPLDAAALQQLLQSLRDNMIAFSAQGRNEAIYLQTQINQELRDPAFVGMLQENKGVGYSQIENMAIQEKAVGDWKGALGVVQAEGAQVMLEMGKVFRQDVRLSNGFIVRNPAAYAFRALDIFAVNGKTYAQSFPGEKEELVRQLGWWLQSANGTPMGPGQSELHFYARIATVVYDATWTSAQRGDKTMKYAWNTLNLDQLYKESAVHPIFETPEARAALGLFAKGFWEYVADFYPNSQTVGLKVNRGGKMVYAPDLRNAMVENIDFSMLPNVFAKMAADAMKADVVRDKKNNSSWLHTGAVGGFIADIANARIMENWGKDSPERANAIFALFEPMVEKAKRESGTIGKPNYKANHLTMNHLFAALFDESSIDFTKKENLSRFRALQEKYQDHFDRGYKRR